MKKISLLLVAFLVFGGAAFAQQDVSLGISGSVTAEWGVDLDTNDTGFKNGDDTSATLTISGGSAATEGDGWYGSLSVTVDAQENSADFSGAISSVTGRITNGTVYVQLWGAPSDSFSLAGVIEDDDVDQDAVSDPYAAGPMANDQGIILGLMGEEGGVLQSASLEVISNGDWATNTDNEYGVVANAVLLLAEGINVDVSAGYSDLTEGKLMFGVGPRISLDPITLNIGFDAEIPNGGELGFEAFAGLDFVVQEGLTVDADFYILDDADMDLYFALTEAVDGGAVDQIGFGVTAKILDLVQDPNSLDIDVDGNVEYNDGSINFKAGGGYLVVADADPVINANVYLGLLTGLTTIENTVIYADWTADDLTEADATADNELGVFKIGATISL